MIFFTFSAVIFAPKRIGRRQSVDPRMLLCFKKRNVSPPALNFNDVQDVYLGFTSV